MGAYITQHIPQAFVLRRLHSLTGLGLVIYLIEHLLTNSQAALWIGNDGTGFVRAVNAIQNIPYLTAIEILLIGLPLIIHGWWGIKYMLTAEANSTPSDGTRPSLEMFPRNKAYTWQRITSWMLLILIIAHVFHMRFLEYPSSAKQGTETFYATRLKLDNGLYPLSQRLDFELYDRSEIRSLQQEFENVNINQPANLSAPEILIKNQEISQRKGFVQMLKSKPLGPGQVMAVANNFGTAELLMVRETFKNPGMILLYTLLVLSAAYHGFNGLWTFCITWGISLTQKSQYYVRIFSNLLMFVITFLGLAAIWATYWINLKN